MKVGIRYADNDYGNTIRAFLATFIVPTFIEREDGHMVTHLTSSMIVELFNTHISYLHRYIEWYTQNPHRKLKDKLEDNPLYTKNYLIISEMEVYWDDKTDDYVGDWKTANNNFEFHWTDGKNVYS